MTVLLPGALVRRGIDHYALNKKGTNMTDTRTGSDHVAEALRLQLRRKRDRNRQHTRSRDHPDRSAGGIDTGPASTYEVITRHMVTDLADDVREIKSRLNALFFVIIGGILLDIVSRVMGL
jgi:hypothetical protein